MISQKNSEWQTWELPESAQSVVSYAVNDEDVWTLGEDARLREDLRFRPTPWRRWILATDYLANDSVVVQLREGVARELSLGQALEDLEPSAGRRCVFCPSDSRVVVAGDAVRLSAQELSERPLVEHDVDELAKFTTHLPLHDLPIAAACTKPANWSALIHEQTVNAAGWLEVQLAGRRLNDRQFVARVSGRLRHQR